MLSVSTLSHNWSKISFVCFCPNPHRFSRRKVDTDSLKCRMFTVFLSDSISVFNPGVTMKVFGKLSLCLSGSPSLLWYPRYQVITKNNRTHFQGFVNSEYLRQIRNSVLFACYTKFCKYLRGMTQTNFIYIFEIVRSAIDDFFSSPNQTIKKRWPDQT